MNRELLNALNLHSEAIILTASQNLAEIDETELKNGIIGSLKNIENSLMTLSEEEYKDVYEQILRKIVSELRRKIIGLCQQLLRDIIINGRESLELFIDSDFIQINRLNTIMDICNGQLESLESAVEDEGKKIYIFTDAAIRDFKALPLEFTESFEDIIDIMITGIHDRQGVRKKILRDNNLEGTIEYRGNLGTRVYENRIKAKNNANIRRRVAALEQELGASIHFVYKFEIKKCNSEDGLDTRRIERYKQDRDEMKSLVMKLSAEEIEAMVDDQEGKLKKVIAKKKKERNESKNFRVLAMRLINMYLHTDYKIGIFEGEVDEKIRENAISGENAEAYEKYRTYERIIKYLDTKELDELKKLISIFDLPVEIQSEDIDENISINIKSKIKVNERLQIISSMMYALRELELEELREAEIEIIMVFDYEEEYAISSKAKERKYA